MAAWSRKTLKKIDFFAFWKLRGHFQNSVRKKITGQRSTCCVQISWNSADWKSIKSCVIYLTKNSPGSQALVTTRITLEICQSQPPTINSECCRFHPNRFTFGEVISERVNTVRAHSKVNPVFGWSLASSRITNRWHFGSISQYMNHVVDQYFAVMETANYAFWVFLEIRVGLQRQNLLISGQRTHGKAPSSSISVLHILARELCRGVRCCRHELLAHRCVWNFH